eukprot:5957321-Pleurochrysis_carterae.AAC.1
MDAIWKFGHIICTCSRSKSSSPRLPSKGSCSWADAQSTWCCGQCFPSDGLAAAHGNLESLTLPFRTMLLVQLRSQLSIACSLASEQKRKVS